MKPKNSFVLVLLLSTAFLAQIAFIGSSAYIRSAQTSLCAAIAPTVSAVSVASTPGTSITIHTNKQSYSRAEPMNITIVTQIDRTSLRWEGYLVEISMIRYSNGTVKPLSFGGLGYANQTELTHSHGRRQFLGDVQASVPAGVHTITGRLIQITGVNVPYRGPNTNELTVALRRELQALLLSTLTPGPNARILIEANAQFSVSERTSSASDLGPLPNPPVTPFLLAMCSEVRKSENGRARRLALAISSPPHFY